MTPFSATRDYTFKFKYQGPQFVGVELKIEPFDEQEAQNPESTIIIPENHMASEITVPMNTLTNGKHYKASVRVQPINGTMQAEWSEPIQFWCYGDPEFHFIINGVVPSEHGGVVRIESSSQVVELYYYQVHGEGIKSFKIELFGADGRKIQETQEKYATGDIRYDTTQLSATIRGLEDNHLYSILATAETDHGMIVRSDRAYLEVEYEHPATFSLIDVENMPDDAMIRIHSNLVLMEGHAYPDPPKYIDDKRIDLTGYGSYVTFDKGFNLNGDFTLHLVGQNFHEYAELLSIKNGSNDIRLTFIRGWYDENQTEKAYLRLEVEGPPVTYEQYSSFLDVPFFDDVLHIYIRRRNGLYDVEWCICESGSHIITNPKGFDVRFRSDQEWNAVITEGYRNVTEDRLEF